MGASTNVCGICGAAGVSISPSRLRVATEMMLHRGPDEDGYFCDANVALGMRRLKIIDLSSGQQPKTNETDTITLIFNGEIYNYRELRTELRAKGHEFRSNSDTEVIVHAYEEWGQSAFAKLNGIFGVALWDEREQHLVLARDHVGIKPLYYRLHEGELVFGSELKPLLALLAEIPTIDPESFLLYLRYSYVPCPRSILTGVNKLPPGHCLVFDLTSREVRVSCYWDPIRFADNGTRVGGVDEVEELVENTLRDAVRRQLISDVPIGAFLSGGIDSSLVVSMMAEVSEQTPKTFCIGFNEKLVDESGFAADVAKHLGTEHHERIVTADEALAALPRLQHFFDEPFADASSIPTYLVSAFAREHVTVSLSGDGGDEMFGGYQRYQFLLRSQHLWHVPRTMRVSGVAVGRRLPGKLGNNFRVHGAILSHSGLDQVYRCLVTAIEDRDIDTLTPMTAEDIRHDTWPVELFDGRRLIESMMLTDLMTYLPDDILTKVDRASMAWSLESRVPLLDREFMELVLSLPVEYRAYKGMKGLLKRILRRRIPNELVDRPKRGFGIPIHDWLRNELYESLTEHLSAESIARHGLLDPEGVRRLIEVHRSGRTNYGYSLWPLYVFQMWYEHFYAVALREHARVS
jgi:asparagine synthase (glutamine-hydrolysing)